MRRLRLIILVSLMGAMRAAALNPIHESSYSLLPRGNSASDAAVSVAGIMRSGSGGDFDLPVSLQFQVTRHVELGGGIKTHWGDGGHVPYLVFGAKYLTPGATSFQADFMIGSASGSGKGFALGAHHRFGYSRRFQSRLVGKLGFMDALVDEDALLAFEVGFYPSLMLMRPLTFELGLITSSQTENFDSHFAMDLQPALLVGIGKESVVETAVAWGLTGDDRKEDLRVKVAIIWGF